MAVTGGGTAARVFVGAADPWPGAIREILTAARRNAGELDLGPVAWRMPDAVVASYPLTSGMNTVGFLLLHVLYRY